MAYGVDTVVTRLRQVGCTVTVTTVADGPAGLTVEPPSWRPDLTDPADLAEEVIRLEGYEHIPVSDSRATAGRGIRRLSGVTAGQQDSTLSKAAFAAPVSKIIGPVKSQFGYYLIRVTKVKAATQRSLAQSTALIKQTLQSQLTTSAQTAVDNHAKTDWLKKTSCRTIYAMADCKGYKAPKTSSTAGAAGATAPPAGATAPPAGATAPPAGATAPAGAAGTATAP